jgi:dTDP-3,4-didehydro-2,6-dideoxy-alpha-D-glucose 3-reductase
MVRFGLIACSSIARRRFVPALKVSTVARLERVGSRDPAKAQQFAKEFGCAKFGANEDVLADPDVDMVYISTPIALHEQWARLAVQHGKNVLCEKSSFRSHAAARDVLQLCAVKNVRFMEGFGFRYHPQHALVQKLIAEGRIGTPRLFHGELTYPKPPAGDFRHDAKLGGGVFFDAGGYPVAAALMTLPSAPVSVSGRLHFENETGVDDTVAVTTTFAGGEVAQCAAGFGLHYRSRYSVTGTEGRIELERAFSVLPDVSTVIVVETKTGSERITAPQADMFRLMIDDFANEIAGGKHERDFEGQCLKQTAVMDAAWRSNREGRTINLAEYFK